MPIYFILLEATPRRNTSTAPRVAGAFVNCWIEHSTPNDAVRVARSLIESHGWIAGEPDEVYPVNTETYVSGKSGGEYYKQALTDKEVLVFNTFPEVDGKPGDQ